MDALLHKAGRGVICLALLLAISNIFGALPALAAGGFALSGSFSAQEYELPQGSSLKSPEVYVVLFNNTDSDLNVRMTTQAPPGVRLVLTANDFPLKAGGQKKVDIGIEVTADATPGEHEISVTAEPYKVGATGIQIMGAASQSARLVVVGEASRITARAVSADGQPVPGVVRLARITAGQSTEVAYSETGVVEATVAPGSFVAAAYIAGEKLAEESFEVAADQHKTVDLVVQAIYFEGFGLVPNYRGGTQELAFAEIVYTIKNLYKPVEKVEVILWVSFNGAAMDEVSLVTLSSLEKGRLGLRYNYTPREGWKQGSYGFKLQLNIGEKVYSTSPQEELRVGEPSQTAGSSKVAAGIPTYWLIVAGVAVVVVLVAIIIALIRRRGY
jgi:hypothetical protein